MVAQVGPREEIGYLRVGGHGVFPREEIVGVVGGEEGAEGFCGVMIGEVSMALGRGGMVVRGLKEEGREVWDERVRICCKDW